MHKDFFVEFSIEKSAVEVENFNRPVKVSGNGEDGAKTGEFGNRGKCFRVIDTVNLSKSSCDKSSLVLGNATIGVLLDVKDPFGSNNVLARWAFDDGPGVCIV